MWSCWRLYGSQFPAFRIGAATTAVRVGLPDHLIKTLVAGLVTLISYTSERLNLTLQLSHLNCQISTLLRFTWVLSCSYQFFMWPLVKFSRSQQFNYKGISFIVFLLAGVCSASNLGLVKLRRCYNFCKQQG